MKEEIRVLQKVFCLTAGGVETVITDYQKELYSKNIKFDYLLDVNEQDEYLDNKIYAMNSKKICLGLWTYDSPIIKNRVKRCIKEYKDVKMILTESKYDVIHINDSVLNSIIIALAAKKANIPVIIAQAHTNNEKESRNIIGLRILNKILRFILTNIVDYCIAITKHAAQWYFTDNHIRNKKVIYLKNGIDSEKYIFNIQIRERFRKKLKVDNDTIVIGNVGRFTYAKNQEFLIDILYELTILRPEKKFMLLLIGRDNGEGIVQEKIKKYKLEKSVCLYGISSEVAELMQAMDIFVCPSRFEGLGIVNIEAQAASLPTICSTEVPIEAKISDLFFRIPLEVGAKKWAEIILEKYENNIKRHNMQDIVINSGYDKKLSAEILERLYKESLRGKLKI